MARSRRGCGRAGRWTALLGALVLLAARPLDAADEPASRRPAGPVFNEAGALIRPDGWREWVFVGAPVTPNDLNDGKAAFPEFHNVYIDPASFAAFRKTGEFPDGTMLAKELVSVGNRRASSGNGYFQGEFQGLEISVKDRRRFVDEPGGWAFFSFGHEKLYNDTARALPQVDCNDCHGTNASRDYVFVEYYPVLRAALEARERPAGKPAAMPEREAREAAAAMGPGARADTPYEANLFNFLEAGSYRGYRAETAAHRSEAFEAHGASGLGARLCVGCHSRGKDFVLTGWPLR